jgi:hypothetical protein
MARKIGQIIHRGFPRCRKSRTKGDEPFATAREYFLRQARA